MNNREADQAGHPPTCTCVDCCNRRLGGLGKKPSKVFRRLLGRNKMTKTPPQKTANRPGKTPSWLLALLLIFSLSIIGLGTNIFVGSPIPLWLLFGFSIIYSIEKWARLAITRGKVIGKLYKLALNLSILSILGLLVWSGIQLFSKQLTHSPLVDSLVFLTEFILFIWLWKVIAQNRWRWPSAKLTVFSLICIAIIFTFAGVKPMSTYKDNFITDWKASQAEKEMLEVEEEAQKPEGKERWYPVSPLPWEEEEDFYGTYTADWGGIEYTITFEEEILTSYDKYNGKHIYTYSLRAPEVAQVVKVTNVVTGETRELNFSYSPEHNAIMINWGWGAEITYFKESRLIPKLIPKLEPTQKDPQGTYYCTVHFGGTITFKEGKLSLYNAFGRYTYKYEIIKRGTAILLTDIATSKVKEQTFRYIQEDGCVVLDGISYWKERGIE